MAQLVAQAVHRHGQPRHFISDQGAQFTSQAFRSYLNRLGVRQRFGAIGRTGSIAVIERFWKSSKTAWAFAPEGPCCSRTWNDGSTWAFCTTPTYGPTKVSVAPHPRRPTLLCGPSTTPRSRRPEVAGATDLTRRRSRLSIWTPNGGSLSCCPGPRSPTTRAWPRPAPADVCSSPRLAGPPHETTAHFGVQLADGAPYPRPPRRFRYRANSHCTLTLLLK